MTAEPLGPRVTIDPPDDAATRLLNRALSLAGNGYYVFPVKVTVDPGTGANEKTYLTRAATPGDEAWGATRDASAIHAWWGASGRFAGVPGVMIGIATGPSGVVLIDLDVKHGQDGPGEWRRLHPDSYPFPAAIGHSSTGGIHLAYRADPKRPVKTSAGELAPGVDTRGIGGMFVCWAKWLPAVSGLPKVPDIVTRRVPKVTAPVPPPGGTAELAVEYVDNLAPLDVVQARVIDLAGDLAAAPVGMGNETASTIAWKVGGYVGAGQVSPDWALTTLLDAFRDWSWRKPRDEATMRNTVQRQLDAGAKFPRPWTSTEPLGVTVLPPATPASRVGSEEGGGGEEGPAPEAGPAAGPRPAAATPPGAVATPGPPSTGGAADEGDPRVTGQPTGPAAPQEAQEGQQVPSGRGSHVRRLTLVPASSIPPKRVRWTWEGRWAMGALTLVAGKQGLGKSTIVYERAARVTRGELEGEFLGRPGAVMVCAMEDSWEFTIVPRLMAAGADLDKVFRIDVSEDGLSSGLVLPKDLLAVEHLVAATGAVMLVLDPLTSRLDAGLDSHKDAETRRALEPVAEMAGRANLVVVGLIHQNKGGKSDPLDSVMGSTAFSAVARSVSFVMRDPHDETRQRKLFGTEKNNLGRDNLPTLAFATVGHDIETEDGPANVGRVEWLGEVEGSIRDAMEAEGQDPETRTAIGDAGEWLRQFLTACSGSADSMAVKDAGRAEGHNAKTLQRALKRIGGRAESVQNAFPRRTIWSYQRKTDKLTLISQPIRSEDNTPQTTKQVLTVSTVVTSGDSGDSGDRFTGRDTLSRLQSPLRPPLDEEHPEVPAEADALPAPAWATGAREPDPPSPAPDPLPCSCGRTPETHTRSNWVTCPAGHRYHGLGFRALPTCPQCGDGT